VRIDLPIEFSARDSWGRLAGVARDVSLGGMFVETAFPAPFGASVSIGFVLEGLKTPVLLPATVRWTTAKGMGIQFGPLGARETYAITELTRRGRTPTSP
jgi:hypothetical protein